MLRGQAWQTFDALTGGGLPGPLGTINLKISPWLYVDRTRRHGLTVEANSLPTPENLNDWGMKACQITVAMHQDERYITRGSGLRLRGTILACAGSNCRQKS